MNFERTDGMDNRDRTGAKRAPEAANPLMLQAFAWDLNADSSHWRLLAENAAFLAACGVSSMWLPPPPPGGGGGGGGGGAGRGGGPSKPPSTNAAASSREPET